MSERAESKRPRPVSVHFWTRYPDALNPWDPDAEPGRYASGYGHAFLELYWRLKASGRPVSLGPKVAAGAHTVVASLEEVSQFLPRVPHGTSARLALALLRMPRLPALVMLRVDVPNSILSPRYTTLEIMPTLAGARGPGRAWLPMLPQRGLVPRDERRGDALGTVAIKTYSYNLPLWLDERFEHEVSLLGYRLRIDDEHSGRWHDFRDIDVVLCTHPRQTIGDEQRKPATKLINAWRAGAVPVCGDYVGYREIGAPDENMLIVEDDPEGHLTALRRLRETDGLAERIRGSAPQDDYSPEVVTDAYWRTFANAPRVRWLATAASLVRAVVAMAVHRIRRTVSIRPSR